MTPELLSCLALALVPSTQGNDPATGAALDAWRAGQRIEAVELAVRRLAEDPGDDALRARLVEWELRLSRFESALGHMAPGDPRRGLALYALARFEEALEHLDPRDPDHVEPRMESLLALGRLDEADAFTDAASELLGEDDPRVAYWRGRRLARAGDHAGAARAFRAALAADPIHQAARFALGRSLLALGETEEGRAVLARHRELVPLVDRYDFVRQSLDLDPVHAPNRAAVAEIEAELGLADRAERSFAAAEALAQGEQRTPIALRHARFFEEVRGDRTRAVEVLERALSHGPDARLHVRAADVLERAGELARAREHLERAAALRPDDPAIRARRERVEAALGGGR